MEQLNLPEPPRVVIAVYTFHLGDSSAIWDRYGPGVADATAKGVCQVRTQSPTSERERERQGEKVRAVQPRQEPLQELTMKLLVLWSATPIKAVVAHRSGRPTKLSQSCA